MIPKITPPCEGKVLLHSCCAPCSGAILECLVENGIRPGVFFSNSNITPKEEYDKRFAELERYCIKFSLELFNDDYDHELWLCEAAKGYESAPERGARCLNCFSFRLQRAARFALENGYSVLATTLASSRWKDLDQVNQAGEKAVAMALAGVGGYEELAGSEALSGGKLAASEGLAGPEVAGSVGRSGGKLVWWAQNWRKGGLQPRRNEIIREENFYNQLWCGCEFSRQNKDKQ